MLLQGPLAFYKGFIPNFGRLGSWNVIMFLTLEQVQVTKKFYCLLFVFLKFGLTLLTSSFPKVGNEFLNHSLHYIIGKESSA